MKFNLFFKLQGPAGTIEVPNKYNPVETDSMSNCLKLLSDSLLPDSFECIAVRVVRTDLPENGSAATPELTIGDFLVAAIRSKPEIAARTTKKDLKEFKETLDLIYDSYIDKDTPEQLGKKLEALYRRS